jgi:signal transduction histidine kinase
MAQKPESPPDRKSRRLVSEADQVWNLFLQTHKVGQAITGEVSRIYPYGAFVEFSPGLQGLVHRSQILPDQLVEVEQYLWPGDQVRAVILRIDHSKRQVYLSIAEYLNRIRKAGASFGPPDKDLAVSQASAPAAGALPEAGQAFQLEREAETFPYILRSQPGYLQHILVVEDQGDLGDSLSTLLNEAGYTVQTIQDAARVAQVVASDPPDLLLMDAHIPGKDGVDLAAELLALDPELRIVLLSGYPLSPHEEQKLAGLSLVSRILKPFTIQELDQLLLALEHGVKRDSIMLDPAGAGEATQATAEPDFRLESQRDLNRAIAQLLASLVLETGATAGAVFAMDLVSKRVELAAQSGLDLEVFERERQDLDLSPIKDVIVEGEKIFEGDVVRRSLRGKFRFLLRLLDFRACLAFPLATAGSLGYGLFLFHAESGHFSVRHRRQAGFAAASLKALIERYAIQELLVASQSFALLGQISAGLAHEVNNRINALINQAGLLQRYSQVVARASRAGESITTPIPQLLKQVEAIQGTTDRLYHIALLFQQLISPQQGSVCNLAVTLPRVLELLSVTARKNRVELQLDPLPEALPLVSANDVALEQALINLVLNAIQQIGDQQQADGRVSLSASLLDLQGERWVQVVVRDSGPGIHRQLWERVFELGFSTRKGGSGIGLFVTRSALAKFGARVFILESPILAGTSFAIQLQVAREQGGFHV